MWLGKLNMKITASILITLAILGLNSVNAEKPKGEFFLAAPPKGWTLANKDVQADLSQFKFVPATENIERWSEMVTITKIAGTSSTPDQFLDKASKQNTANCADYQMQRLPFKSSDGYPTQGMIELCSTNKTSSKGELTVIRSIKGADYLFAIQKTWRLDPYELSKGLPIPKEKIDEAVLYFAAAKVCDTRKGTCPANMGK